MNKYDIIKLARQAGLQPYYDEQEPAIEAFANLVADAERENIAKMCEEYETENDVTATWLNIVAAGIRARGTT